MVPILAAWRGSFKAVGLGLRLWRAALAKLGFRPRSFPAALRLGIETANQGGFGNERKATIMTKTSATTSPAP